MNDYYIRKQNEIDFLQKFINSSGGFNDKENIISEIKSEAMRTRDIPLSNLTEDVYVFGKNTLSYSYLRFKHDFKIFNEQKLIGLKYKKNYHHKTIYFNSGMSAITALLESIFELKNIALKSSKDLYFETHNIINKKNLRNKKKYFEFYDAIDPYFDINALLSKKFQKSCLGIIIDTTCLTENKLDKIVDKVIAENKMIFFVKSLTKLDMLATEYSRLGMLTIITPMFLNKSNSLLYQFLYVNIVQKNINYNCCPAPVDFPLFWDDDNFFLLNKIRISHIKANNEIVYRAHQTNKNFKVINPTHHLFLLINPNKHYNRNELIEMCKEIISKLRDKYDIRFCGSFGFDFIAMDTYINVSDNKETIRLSLNDYSKEKAEDFAKDFWRVLNDCF